ncbi:MAG: hypothetical protein CMJ32_03460 [Phycisphaerae bacterium]|nr:hypothetical protein [Phycisphaerae bacterium]
MPQSKPRTLLIITQVYLPDTPAVGQLISEAAAMMVSRGFRVIVYTSNRDYETGRTRYPSRETINGVEVVRLPWSSFGKGSLLIRMLAGLLFVKQASIRGLFLRGLDGVLVSTAPPFASMAAIFLRLFRRKPFTYWAMDLNPDQMIAMGTMSERSLVARFFNRLNRMTLRRCAATIAMDRFMADRLNAKLDIGDRMHVIAPGPMDKFEAPVPHQDNPFRKEHGLQDKFVIMYSGNHGLTTPVTTLVKAALATTDPRIVYMFIGGGIAKQEVEDAIRDHAPDNIISLPYQPLSELRHSLSAADVHAVTILPEVVGVIHPCKIYGAMGVRRPILMVGPEESHVSDLVEAEDIGWRVDNGDVDGLVRLVRSIVDMDPADLAAMGERAHQVLEHRFSKERLFGMVCRTLSDMMHVNGDEAAVTRQDEDHAD